MKGFTKIIIILVLTCSFSNIRAQSPVVISDPALSMKSGKVLIEYGLLNSARSDKFTVRIKVTLESGKQVPASSLNGDVGEGVTGGGNRKIVWDIEADSVFLDEDIFVVVYAWPEAPPVAVVPLQEEQEEPESTETEEPPVTGDQAGKEFSRTGLIIQSMAFPGLGLSRITGAPHWLRGVAGYGCLAGSVYLNRMGWSTYQDYLNSEDPAVVDDLFDQAYNAKKRSQILGYAAIGIWVVDLAWTIAGTSGMNKGQLSDNAKGFSLGTTVEPLSNVPMIALCYRF